MITEHATGALVPPSRQEQTSNTIQTLANQAQPGLQLDPSFAWYRAVIQSNLRVLQF